MNDDVKAANEALVESMVRQLRDCVSVGDEMTLDHASLIDDAVDWIAGEAARTAAAVAAAREEQAQSDLTSMMHSHATGESWSCNLTATPLADRIAVMGLQMTELEGLLKRAEAERDAARADAKARVEDWNNERTTVVMERRRANDLEAERDHIRKELAEIELDPADLKEWVDVVLLALDGAWRAGWTPEEIAGAIEAKQTKNEARTWPDWRTAAPDKAIEHVKSPVCPDCERNGGECSRHNLDQP